MATFNFETVDRMEAQNNNNINWFKLENNGDKALVRYMYNTINDVTGHIVHQIEAKNKTGDKYFYPVNCLRNIGDDPSVCPFCNAGMRTKAQIYVPLYVLSENNEVDRVQIWNRGSKFLKELQNLCEKNNPLIQRVFEITRNGAKGDPKTTYVNYPTEREDYPEKITLKDLPPIPDIAKDWIKNKTYDEMCYYLENGEFPDTSTDFDVNELEALPPTVVKKRNAVKAKSNEDEF